MKLNIKMYIYSFYMNIYDVFPVILLTFLSMRV